MGGLRPERVTPLPTTVHPVRRSSRRGAEGNSPDRTTRQQKVGLLATAACYCRTLVLLAAVACCPAVARRRSRVAPSRHSIRNRIVRTARATSRSTPPGSTRRSTSKTRTRLFPARSSSAPPTRSVYAPGVQSRVGWNVHALSPSATVTVPGTAAPIESSTTRSREARAWSSGSPNAIASGALVPARGGVRRQDDGSGERRSASTASNAYSNPYASGAPAPSTHASSMTRR